MPNPPLLHLPKLAPGCNIDSLQCSTAPALGLPVELGSLRCSTETRLGRSGHVTANWRPQCKKTVTEATIWYRSDVAFATAFFQHWGTALELTVKTTTVTHDRSKHFMLLPLLYFIYSYQKKAAGFFICGKRQIAFNCNIKVCYMPNHKTTSTIQFFYFYQSSSCIEQESSVQSLCYYCNTFVSQCCVHTGFKLTKL